MASATLSPEEFTRLVAAARAGKEIVKVDEETVLSVTHRLVNRYIGHIDRLRTPGDRTAVRPIAETCPR